MMLRARLRCAVATVTVPDLPPGALDAVDPTAIIATLLRCLLTVAVADPQSLWDSRSTTKRLARWSLRAIALIRGWSISLSA